MLAFETIFGDAGRNDIRDDNGVRSDILRKSSRALCARSSTSRKTASEMPQLSHPTPQNNNENHKPEVFLCFLKFNPCNKMIYKKDFQNLPQGSQNSSVMCVSHMSNNLPCKEPSPNTNIWK